MSSIVWFFKFTIGFGQIKIGTRKITSLNFNNRVCGPMIFAIFPSLTLSFVETRIIQGSRPLSWRFGAFGFFLTL